MSASRSGCQCETGQKFFRSSSAWFLKSSSIGRDRGVSLRGAQTADQSSNGRPCVMVQPLFFLGRSLMQWFRGALIGAVLVFGCASNAQQRAQDGVKALAACDMRGAHAAFSDAYGMDSTDPQIALAFALTDLTLLAEDPALETLRPRFGFTKPFDTSFMWEKGGFMVLAS